MRATNDLEMVVPDPEWLGQVLNDIDHYERVVEVPQIDSSKTPARKVRSIASHRVSRRQSSPWCHMTNDAGDEITPFRVDL